MSETVPTIKVKATDPEQGEFVLINESDFDSAVHERFEAEPAEPKRGRKPAASE